MGVTTGGSVERSVTRPAELLVCAFRMAQLKKSSSRAIAAE